MLCCFGILLHFVILVLEIFVSLFWCMSLFGNLRVGVYFSLRFLKLVGSGWSGFFGRLGFLSLPALGAFSFLFSQVVPPVFGLCFLVCIS